MSSSVASLNAKIQNAFKTVLLKTFKNFPQCVRAFFKNAIIDINSSIILQFVLLALNCSFMLPCSCVFTNNEANSNTILTPLH